MGEGAIDLEKGLALLIKFSGAKNAAKPLILKVFYCYIESKKRSNYERK